MPSRPATALLLACLAAVFASATGVARAGVYPVGSPVWAAAERAAAAHWGGLPCAGDVKYGWPELAPGVLGYATWRSPSSAPADPSRFTACRIDLSASVDLDPEQFCTALAHEMGHLHGLPHSTDPDDLMAPALGEPLAECVTALAPLRPAAPPAAEPAAKPRAHGGRAAKAKPAKRRRGHHKRPRGRRG